VATAMGMIMHYWGYPAQGTGSHSYTPAGYPEQMVNFGETTYDWANMPDQLTATSTQAEIDAVSTLLWHCGVAVNMMYGTSSSGTLNSFVPMAFRDYFGYSEGMSFYSPVSENDSVFVISVKSSLNEGTPVMFFSTDVNGQGSHAFVCDGYSINNQFHFNWGWGGNGNGYFAINALNVQGLLFNVNTQALFGIKPLSELTEFQLQYNIIDGGVEVTYEQLSPDLPTYYNYPDTIVIPSQVTINDVDYPVIAIGDHAFQLCIRLKSVVMPNTITSIGDSAFFNDYQITRLDLPDNLIEIGEASFLGLSLSSLDLPTSLTTIGPWAFSWINFYNLCIGIDEYLTAINIPQSLTSCGHDFIAFTSVDTLNWNADSCAFIHEGSFWAFGVSELNFGNHVRYIPDNIFSNNYFTSITFPESLVHIGEGCFYNCDNLTSIAIPKNVEYIGNSTFDDCSNLVTVNFNAKRCEYAPYLFERCGNLETVNFGDSVRIVPGNLCVDVLYTPSITTLNFGQSIDTIEGYAFGNCANLTAITLPASIKFIDNNAFSGCSGLTTVDLTSVINPPTLGFFPFYGNAETRKFVIPCESYDEYYNAEGWYYHDGGGDPIFDYDYRIDLKAVPETEIQLTAIPNDTIQGNVLP